MKLKKVESQEREIFDYLVIGAGSTGCVLASRLAEYFPDKLIGLVEAGGRASVLEAKIPIACSKLQGTDLDWQYTTEPSDKASLAIEGRRSKWPRGKCLGGSSCLNYMAYVRGCAKDYDVWETQFKCHNFGWKALLPHFLRSEHNETIANKVQVDGLVLDERFHGQLGPLVVSSNPTPGLIPKSFVDACVEQGFEANDYNCGDIEGVASVFQQTIAKGARADVATCYLYNKKRQYPNLTVIAHAHATKLVLDGRRIVGAEFLSTESKAKVTLQAKEVVVSCGAIGSPQLLKLSGIGPKDELEAVGIDCEIENPHVGHHLEDHLATCLYLKANDGLDIGATNARRAEGLPWSLWSIFKWLIWGRGLHATSAYDGTLFFSTKAWKKSHPQWGPDGQITVFSSPGDENTLANNIGVTSEYNTWREYYSAKDAQAALLMPTLLHMESEGSVTLKSNDPMANPKINAGYFENKNDIARMIEIVKKGIEIAQSPAMQKICGEVILPKDLLEKHANCQTNAFWEDYLRLYAFTLYHPSSTCRMGDVCDPETLRVKNVDGLRVADASVFPTMVSGNPNAVCIMIGEKLAHDIKNNARS